MDQTVIIYITTSSHDEAKRVGHHLLQRKLVACANIIPITSIYRWGEAVNEDQECVLLLKTLDSKYEEILKQVKTIHSYTTPCVAKIPVSFNQDYLSWLVNELQG